MILICVHNYNASKRLKNIYICSQVLHAHFF